MIVAVASFEETKHSYIPSPDDRVDQPGRIADEERPLPGDLGARTAERQSVAAEAVELPRLEAVGFAGSPKVLPELRPFALPATHADVHVVGLREDPGVPAGDVGELEDQLPRVPLSRHGGVGRVPLVGDAVDDPLAEPDRLCGDPVGAVGADEHVGGHALARVENDRVMRLERDPDSLAHLGPTLTCRIEQERVEPPALRHPHDGLVGAVDDGRVVAEAKLDLIDELFDDRSRVDRALPDRPEGHPAAARLVAREGCLVDEEHGDSLLGKPVRGRRSGRSAADDDRVVALHGVEATMLRLRGGVPERPKGTGCKPVGSAYGGSNPPAPTFILASTTPDSGLSREETAPKHRQLRHKLELHNFELQGRITVPVQVTTIMIGVRDLARARTFYAEGLDCPVEADYPGFVSLNLGDGSSSLALYEWDAAAADAGVSPEGTGFSGVSFHYIVDSRQAVDEVLGRAAAAGGDIVKAAADAQWGGYYGYFADPDGHLWKVATSA